MSWLRSALSKAADKAAEVGSKNNLSRTVRSVYHQAGHAVAGGAKIVQERLSGRNLNSYKDAVKRLNEVSLNAKGAERLQALARWLLALKELDREIKRSRSGHGDADPASPKHSESEDNAVSPRKAHMAFFYDFENGGEPMNFRDVFLQSRALEHIVTSLILEAPQDEEVAILLEIFGLCLAGGKELHNAFISSIQDLAKAFATLSDEVEIKKSDLLQMAQAAVSGLKLSTEAERLDAEICYLQQKISEKQGVIMSKDNLNSNEESKMTEEVLEYGARIRNCLYRKEELLRTGDTAESRGEKVQKLREVTAGLTNSITEIEKRVLENRQQKEKAIKYRDTKDLEVLESEKGLAKEIHVLENRKEQLEAELKEVNSALSVATARHINTQEEKEQFDEASSNVVAHLCLQEGELSRSMAARKAEAGVASTWVGFLEDTWLLQSGCTEQKMQDIQRDLQEAKKQFFSIASMNLSYHQEEMKLLLKRLKFFSDEIETMRNKRLQMDDMKMEGLISDVISGHRKVQDKYVETEEQILHILRITDSLAEEVKSFGLKKDGDDVENKITKSLEAIENLKAEFRAFERPEIEQHKDVSPEENKKPEENKEASSPNPPHAATHETVTSGDSSERDDRDHGDVESSEMTETDGWEFGALEEALRA